MYISTYGGNRPVRTPPVCQKPPSKPITNTPSIGTPLRQPPQTVINLGLSLFGVGEWVGGVVVLVG